MLTFHYQPDAARAATHLANRLVSELQARENVLWLVPGGSNIPLSIQAMRVLPAQHLSKLTCLLTDERYGVPGHADSNWQQLAEAGFMERNVKFPATLVPDLTLQDTCEHYAKVAEHELSRADVVIAQFGVGGDGHIAGILPRSAAVTDEKTDNKTDSKSVVGYDSGAFQRITLTPPALRRVSAAYAFVYGETKRQALEKLQSQDLPLSEQPSQILKELPEAHLYTDQQLNGLGTAREDRDIPANN